MRIKELLSGILFVILTALLLCFFRIGFWQWISVIVIMSLCPVVFSLIKKNNILIWLTTFIPFLVVLIFFFGYCFGLNDYIKIATTDDIRKAEEIEAILSASWYNTIRFVDGIKYTVALRNADREAYKEAVLTIISDDVTDENVGIHVYSNTIAFSKDGFLSKLKKDYKKELPFLINGIEGVYNSSVEVEFSSCFFNMDCEEPYTKAKVKIDTDESFDREEIKNLTEKLLLSAVLGLMKENINIEFNTEPCSPDDKCYNYQTTQRLYRQAKYYYRKNDYNNALKYLEQANQIDDSYTSSINDVKKMMELNAAIQKNPKDYRLYIQRGDIENVFEFSMFYGNGESITSDYYGAVEDYTKALELNPEAYEVYEKRGDAWAEFGYKACIGCKRERTHEYDENVIKDYEQAIKYMGGNDRLYEKLGDRFIENNPSKALEYYTKVQNIHYDNNSEVYLPVFNGEFSSRTYGLLPLKIVQCYIELGEYDKALNLLDEFLTKCDNKEIIQHANNMKFYYNLKAGHFEQAMKNADNCSVLVCKILGVVF